MNKKTLKEGLKAFIENGKTSEELNQFRSEIFNSLDAGEIRSTTKDSLLKELYEAASEKGIFFLRVMDRNTKDLPKTQEEEDALNEDESYEESYEESYSYDEDEDDKS